MSLILAIETDPEQSDTLGRIVRERTQAELILVDSRAAAVAVIDRRLPDLILVSALLSPRDEEELNAHLKALPDATHLQTLTIPQLRRAKEKPGRRRLFSRKRAQPRTGGCDPSVFAAQIIDYLGHAGEMQLEIEQRKTYAVRAAPVDTNATVSHETNGVRHAAPQVGTSAASAAGHGFDDEGWGWTPTVAEASVAAPAEALVEAPVEASVEPPAATRMEAPPTDTSQDEARVLVLARAQADADARVAAELEQAHAEAEERRRGGHRGGAGTCP